MLRTTLILGALTAVVAYASPAHAQVVIVQQPRPVFVPTSPVLVPPPPVFVPPPPVFLPPPVIASQQVLVSPSIGVGFRIGGVNIGISSPGVVSTQFYQPGFVSPRSFYPTPGFGYSHHHHHFR